MIAAALNLGRVRRTSEMIPSFHEVGDWLLAGECLVLFPQARPGPSSQRDLTFAHFQAPLLAPTLAVQG